MGNRKGGRSRAAVTADGAAAYIMAEGKIDRAAPSSEWNDGEEE